MILAILGAIITILILLNRLAEAGIDLGGLNPFLWNRRRRWRKQYEGDPIYKVSDPMEATALLMVGVAKAEGDMTKESKDKILSLFASKFGLGKKDAVALLISTTHIHGTGDELRRNVSKVLKPSIDHFSVSQAKSAISLVESIAEDSNAENTSQLLEDIKQAFQYVFKKNEKQQWS